MKPITLFLSEHFTQLLKYEIQNYLSWLNSHVYYLNTKFWHWSTFWTTFIRFTSSNHVLNMPSNHRSLNDEMRWDFPTDNLCSLLKERNNFFISFRHNNIYLFIIYYYDDMFWSTDHHHAISTQLRTRFKRSANNIFVIRDSINLTKFVSNYTKLISSLWLMSQFDLQHAHTYTPILLYTLKTNWRFLPRYVWIMDYAVLKNYLSTQTNIFKKNSEYDVYIYCSTVRNSTYTQGNS